MKNRIVQVELEEDNGKFTWFIRELGRPGEGSDEYDALGKDEFIADLGKALAGRIFPRARLLKLEPKPEVPKDWPVQPIYGTEKAKRAKALTWCGTCGRQWDDGIVTSMTPVPSGRCPFEGFH